MCEDTQKKKLSSTEIAVPLLGLAENHRMPLTTVQDKHMCEELTQKNSKTYLYTSYNVSLKLPCICNQHSQKSHLQTNLPKPVHVTRKRKSIRLLYLEIVRKPYGTNGAILHTTGCGNDSIHITSWPPRRCVICVQHHACTSTRGRICIQ